jgi:hypothetical protein
MTGATTCRNSSANATKPTRLAVQIDFYDHGVKFDVVYDVQRIHEALLRLAVDFPGAYRVEAKLKEVPLTDLTPE